MDAPLAEWLAHATGQPYEPPPPPEPLRWSPWQLWERAALRKWYPRPGGIDVLVRMLARSRRAIINAAGRARLRAAWRATDPRPHQTRHRVRWRGREQALRAVAAEAGLSYPCLYQRVVGRGLSIEQALAESVRRRAA
jgi:hypothetical protein